MPMTKLKEYLDAHGVKYVAIMHSPAHTALEVAASAHVKGKEMAKTVMLKLNGKLAMVVLPATRKVDLDHLRHALGELPLELAKESEFLGDFPGCEPGAMPPFGNLFGMEVFVDSRLADDLEIVFNAGTHTELIRMAYKDFERLVSPKTVAM